MNTKRIKRDVSGVLLLDKPVGITSNAALQIAKRLYRAAKAGHTGTLDPMASGLLPLCLGEATKFAQYPTDADKSYEAVIKLGETTDTGDADGQMLSQRQVAVSRGDIERVVSQFIGPIMQTPPMYSALKHQGQALYKYARKGIEIERAPRAVTLHQIEILNFDVDTLSIRVDCSKGTYIRVLAEDIGEQLGCGAHLIGLRRTRVGAFTLAEAITLDTLEALPEAERDNKLLPPDCLVASLPEIALDQDAAYYLRQGQALWLPKLPISQRFRIYDEKHIFIGVGEVGNEGKLQPFRLVVQR
ncbi:MAG: tRNA pseudouridine(55) synthase TruB [Burkholderiales bacterium]|nr:tRNA pseudouridine(55) synthase TruB [Burkholderiales bacterium]